MAGDWIKMRVDLADDPAVVGMAALLKTSEYDIVGRLHCLWSWADRHTTNGFVPHITEKWIDNHVGKKGFAKHMSSVGWLVCEEAGVTFPKFDRHNGDSAKKRALKTQAQANWRINKSTDVDRNESTDVDRHESTDEHQSHSTNFSTREEKRREESKPPLPTIDEPWETTEREGGQPPKIGVIDPATGEVVSWAACGGAK